MAPKGVVMTVNEAVPLRSTIPARLDRLRWSPFHTRMVAGLGAAWILDLRHGRSEADDWGTYLISGGSLMISAWLFGADKLNATTQTFVRVVIFFFASAGASAAYLTVSETWPIEIRAEAIAVFLRHRPDLRSPGPR